MAASWPTSVPTDATLYVAVNELQTNLSAGINSAVTTVGLNSTTSFPTVGLVLIDNEIIKYTGISSNNLTGCTRGFDGTTAASHSSAAVVSFAICANHHNVLKDEIEAICTYLSNNLGTGATPLTASRALVSDSSGKITVASVTSAELAFVSGVTSAIQTQLNAKVANPLTGNLAAGGFKLTGLAAGSGSGDSLRYEQLIGLYLLLTGGTMSGNIAMGSNKVTGLAAASTSGDALRYEQRSQMKCGSFAGAAGTGNQAITGVGFTPKLVVFSMGLLTSGNNFMTFGRMDASGNQSVEMHAIGSGVNLNTQNTTACIGAQSNSTGEYVSMDADGFTIHWTSANSAFTYHYMAYA